MIDTNDSIYADANLLKMAEAHCKTQVAAQPGNREALRKLADVYRKQGRLADAAQTYGQIVALNPTDVDASYLHAVLSGGKAEQIPHGTRAAPFVLYRNFLPQGFHDELIPYALQVQDTFIPSLVGNQAEYRPEMRKTLQLSGTWPGRPRFKKHLLEVLEDATDRMYIPKFDLGSIAIQFRAYPDGNYFRTHMDLAPRGPGKFRKFVFVYYFHREPKSYTGGELLIYDTDVTANTYINTRFTQLIPEDNSIVFFPCEYYHSVITVRCPTQEFADSRFVVNGHVSRKISVQEALENDMPIPSNNVSDE